MTQGIIIDVAGEAAGVVNVPREFVYTKIDPVPPLVTLSMGEVASSYFWQIISQPVGASAVLSSTTAASPTFTPTAAVSGTYLIRCTINGSAVYYENATAWKTKYRDYRIPATTEASMYGARGWDAAVQEFLRQVDIDVEGPSSATDYAVAIFDGTTGKLIQDSANLTYQSNELILYEAVNDGNPRFIVGSAAANRAHFQAVYDAGVQTLNYLLISTDSATEGDIVLSPATTGNVGVKVTSPVAYMDVGGANLSNIRSLLLRSGAVATPPSVSHQILFGYDGTNNYLHSIRTRHSAGLAIDNAIDFYVWQVGVDAVSDTPGTYHCMSLTGKGVGIGVSDPDVPLELFYAGTQQKWSYNATNYATAGVGPTGVLTLTPSGAQIALASTSLVLAADSITSTSEGVAASINTIVTEITTNGDVDLDNVTLANGTVDQVKKFVVKAVGNAGDSVKITPATMVGGTQITFAASPLGLGCEMVYTSAGWVVSANNGGVIA